MLDVSRETEARLEERIPWLGLGKLLARLWLPSIAVTAIGVAFLTLMAVAAWVKNHVLILLPGMALPQPSSWTDLALSIAITVVLFGGGAYWFSRRFTLWEKRLISRVSEFLQSGVFGRLEHLEENAVSHRGVVQNIEWLKDRISKLESRHAMEDLVRSPGPHTDRDFMLAGLREAGNPLVVHSARYGIGPDAKESVDVKRTVESYLKDGRIEILVTNETMRCHPFVGKEKTLFVSYSGGCHANSSVAVPESHMLVIPESMTIGKLAGIK